ncbi:actin filament-associated protein 1 isoform X1 [Varanus komodoensis]|uniref:actin filament-associated protein 1 isoform X1 n=1 Tax=Varanus komodoensis TaxID=61221 RepID=UPI001CF7AC78|nr:actin filament-associated protein 1 isoform X1 [Varanus komodoensis]XP_044298828.1 actin filament-associated protein 1 isoform X1 [Varanus komodoensis]
MEELIVELQLFLQLLDHEYLTTTVREKKAVLNNILLRIQSSKDFEIKENAQKQDAASGLPAPPQMPLPEIPQQWLPPDNSAPPLPSSSLPEGYYEEAVPLSPGKAPEYITSNYDSDAMSSSYESYDEEDEDGKGKKMRHQWPSEEASMDLVKDAKICAFLLRKKRFGQWSKVLCVIKENKLLCYKSSKDQQPLMELLLTGCSITYVPKDGKKKKHELKIAQQGQDALVLAVQSKAQADQWLKVVKEVCSNCVGTPDLDGASSNPPVHKAEVEKKLSSERPSSDGEGTVENGVTAICNGKEQVKRKTSSKGDSKGTVSKVTGKKITKIIGLGKKKPSTDEQTSSAEEDIPTCGYLNVLSNNRWRERWCRVKDNKLIFHKDRTDLKTHIVSIPLRGCEVIPGLDSKHPLTFRLLRNAQEVAVLEASSSEDMGRWIGILLAESGSSADPGMLHYDYIDVHVTASVIQAAKQTFCFMSRRGLSTNAYRGSAANGYACPTGMALHYEDVPCINGSVRIDFCFKGKKASSAANGVMGKGRMLNNPQKKSEFASSVKRSTSNADQYKYGKNRVEADAKRLQTKEEELLRKKETLRNRLAQLRKERKDLRAVLEANSGRKPLLVLEDKLKKLEDECKLKESERVALELELTEVQGNLKTALAGGIALGLAIEPRPGTCAAQSPVLKHPMLESSPISSCDTSDAECSVPINSAVVLKRHSSVNSSPCRGHVLQKAKEWEMKNGT